MFIHKYSEKAIKENVQVKEQRTDNTSTVEGMANSHNTVYALVIYIRINKWIIGIYHSIITFRYKLHKSIYYLSTNN